MDAIHTGQNAGNKLSDYFMVRFLVQRPICINVFPFFFSQVQVHPVRLAQLTSYRIIEG